MGPSDMGPNFFKKIAKMSLELLGLLLELLLLLLVVSFCSRLIFHSVSLELPFNLT